MGIHTLGGKCGPWAVVFHRDKKGPSLTVRFSSIGDSLLLSVSTSKRGVGFGITSRRLHLPPKNVVVLRISKKPADD